MKKLSIIVAAALLSLTGLAQAQSFDLNSMPLSNIPSNLDAVSTGSVAPAKVLMRTVKRDGASVTQYYTIAKNGAIEVHSEK